LAHTVGNFTNVRKALEIFAKGAAHVYQSVFRLNR